MIGVFIAINIIALCGVMYVTSYLISSFYASMFIACVWILAFNAPFSQWSACEYFYALFDAPSFALSAISLCYLLRFFALLWLKNERKSRRFYPRLTYLTTYLCALHIFPKPLWYIYVLCGIALYGGFLGYEIVDVYRLDFKTKLFILGFLSLLMFSLCPLSGVLLICCIIAYQLRLFGNMDIFNYCIDPFLFFGCIFALFKHLFLRLYYGGMNEKKVA